MKRSHAARDQVRRFLVVTSFAAILAVQATPALGRAPADDEEELPDARLIGYEPAVQIAGGTMGTYMLLAFLGILAVGVTFKSANRSHLD